MSAFRLITIAALCGVAGCAHPNRTEPGPQQFGYRRSGSIGPAVFRGLIQPMNGSAVRGTAGITPEQNGRTFQATIEIVGGAPGSYEWHIHSGTCASVGELLGNRSDYVPFHVGSEGSGGESVRIGTVPPPSGGTFVVIIHASSDPADEGHLVGCGELLNTGV